MTDIAIKVENLTKEFQIGQERSGDFRESFGNTLKTMLSTKGNKETFTALDDISFEVKKGEALGIIGRNGAGKSTLLKILSRITEPTKGRIEINGRVSSLLEVGTGFHPELTGRENIYLNGTILGMTRREVKAKFDEIIDFSGVEKFIDTPVKHYSSGMKVRLAFSVAAHLEPEILIVDEVLAVGDAEFQKKCLGKMDDVSKKEGRTVIFVSHNMGAVEKLCEFGIFLNLGKIKLRGNISNVVDNYLDFVSNESNYISDQTKENIISKVTLRNSNKTISNFRSEEELMIEIESYVNNTLANIYLGVAVKDFRGNKISTILSKINNKNNHCLTFEANTFLSGTFSFDVALFEETGEVYDYIKDACSFTIIDATSPLSKYGGKDVGIVQLKTKWA